MEYEYGLDELGQDIIDKAENILSLCKMNLPDRMKLDACLTALKEIAEVGKLIYINMSGGENPWDDSWEEGDFEPGIDHD